MYTLKVVSGRVSGGGMIFRLGSMRFKGNLRQAYETDNLRLDADSTIKLNCYQEVCLN